MIIIPDYYYYYLYALNLLVWRGVCAMELVVATANEEAEVSGARGTALPTIALLVLKKTGGGSSKGELGDVFRKEL